MRSRALLMAMVLAASVACAGPFQDYEYEEEIYLSLDGSATLYVNSSLAALNALRGTTFDSDHSAAIEKGLVKPEDKIDCQMGQITVAGRLIHDHHPFGVLSVADALAQSSNVGAIKLGLLVGDESMYDYMKRLGFGSRTGIDLAGESAGLLRPLSRWQPSSIGSLASNRGLAARINCRIPKAHLLGSSC